MRAELICCHAPSVSWAEAANIAARAGSSPELLEDELRHYTGDAEKVALYILVDIDAPLGHYRVTTGLRLRAFPVDGAILTVLPKGQGVDMWGIREEGWAFVKAGELGGWCAGEYLERSELEIP